MNELEQKKQVKTEVFKHQERNLHEVLVGKILPKRGHKLFEFNIKDGTIIESKFDTPLVADFVEVKKGNFANKNKKIVKKDCIYISCLNIKNVKKILFRDFGIAT